MTDWFVRNARDARWLEDDLGAYCSFEKGERFAELGLNLSVLRPGRPISSSAAEAYARFAKPAETPFRDEFLPD
jgi:hypothetical protein